VGAGAGVAADVLDRHWSIDGGGRSWFPRRVDVADDAHVEIRMLAGSIRACARPRLRVPELPACVGAEAGAMYGRGVGLSIDRSARRPFVGLSVAPGLAWAPTPRLALGLAAEVVVAALRPRFHLSDAGEVWRAGPIDVRGLFGLELRLP
jgi:hypothetical protein